MNIHIIGTSHIAKQSAQEIKQFILEEKPQLVALELDAQRAYALLHEQKNKISLAAMGQIGLKGYLFAKIGQIVQQKLGKMVGMTPGSEMKTALKLAGEQKIEIALIDQPIQITLKRFSKSLTWKEKGRFLLDLIGGIFNSKKQMKELGVEKWDLQKVPSKEVIAKLVQEMKKKYPSIYRTLVEERNKYMVKKLVQILRQNPEQKILVVVGAGHEEGMKELLAKVETLK